MSNWIAIVHVLGAVQGVFLAAILMSRRRGSLANRLLAVLMLGFALDLGIAVYHATGAHERFPHLIGIDYPLAFLYGPLLYLYARTLSRTEQGFPSSSLWHFLPFGLLVVFLVPFYLKSGAAKLVSLYDPPPGLWSGVLGVVNHLKLVHAFLYIAGTLLLLRRHRRRIRDTFSFTEQVNLSWLQNLMIVIIVMMGLTVILYLLMLSEQRSNIGLGLDPSTEYDDYTLLILAIFVYAIGFMGLRQPEVFDSLRPERHGPELPPEAMQGAVQRLPAATPPEPEKPQYARSGMDPATAQRYKQELLERMATDRLYRRGDLTLQDLSDALSISPHNLTEVINTQLGQNFYDFVNGYRVEEVKARLLEPGHDHLTLLAVGMDAGFNSKSSFNAVFKKHTGMTPSQFRAQARKTVSS